MSVSTPTRGANQARINQLRKVIAKLNEAEQLMRAADLDTTAIVREINSQYYKIEQLEKDHSHTTAISRNIRLAEKEIVRPGGDAPAYRERNMVSADPEANERKVFVGYYDAVTVTVAALWPVYQRQFALPTHRRIIRGALLHLANNTHVFGLT